MAQPSVAREPSMEEILASIRRIIESNEPGASAPPASMASAYVEEEIEDPEELSFVPDMAANDPGLPTARAAEAFSAAQAGAGPAAERSLSLADVAARVRAASARQQENAAVRPVAYPEPPAPVAGEEEIAAAPAPHPAFAATPLRPAMEAVIPAERPRVQASLSAVLEAAASEASAAASESSRAPSVQPEPVQSAPAEIGPAPVEQAQGLPAKIEEAANLLSAEAGAQVARSFNELAAVFNGLEHQSVEEMAQEMLRPMLQEWLDDNLPTLVEKLVREEIERVARGPRR